MSSEYTINQLNYRRSLGVSRAWRRERELVQKGYGTRRWSVKEQKELLKTGRVKGYHGHHMKSVAKHPEHADNPKNVQFLDSRKGNNEHLRAHRGDYRNESDGRYNVQTGRIRPIKDGAPRAMNSYELKDKAIEKRGYEKYSSIKPGQQSRSAQARQKGDDSTTFNGKTYDRAFVKASGRGKEAPKSMRYGEKVLSRPTSARQAEKAGRYGQKVSAQTSGSTQTARRGGYGGSKAFSGGESQRGSTSQGAAHSAGRNAGGHGQGGAHK